MGKGKDNGKATELVRSVTKVERSEAIVFSKSNKRKKIIYARQGSGEPNVLLLSGYGMDLDASWGKIYTALRDNNKVLSYNRLNVGKSGRSKVPQSGKEIVALLQELLGMAEMQPPYIVVGHSIGGIYAQLFARMCAKDVAGVVLVESAYPGQKDISRYCKMGWKEYLRNPNPWRSSEIKTFDETSQQLKEAPAFPNVPLVVVTAGHASPLFQEKQKGLVSLSPQGVQVIAKHSGHYVQNDEPEVIIQAIRDVLANDIDRSYRSYGPAWKKCI